MHRRLCALQLIAIKFRTRNTILDSLTIQGKCMVQTCRIRENLFSSFDCCASASIRSWCVCMICSSISPRKLIHRFDATRSRIDFTSWQPNKYSIDVWIQTPLVDENIHFRDSPLPYHIASSLRYDRRWKSRKRENIKSSIKTKPDVVRVTASTDWASDWDVFFSLPNSHSTH